MLHLPLNHCSVFCCLFLLILIGCGNSQKTHPSSPVSAENLLLPASGACLAKISKLEEFDERPSDGDHYVKAWLDPIEVSGEVPDFLYLVIDYGGMRPAEVLDELEQREMVLRHDSLQSGERHWFVFSEYYDSSKFPIGVAGWWKYDDGNVPHDVVEAVASDRFAAQDAEP